MAVTTIEGLLEIDLVDVYGWLSAEQGIADDVRALGFSIEEDALMAEFASGKPAVFVDAAQFWTWVIGEHLPAGLRHYETVFGVPAVDASNGVLAITFAASNECDPRSWSKPPACLAEWERRPSHAQ